MGLRPCISSLHGDVGDVSNGRSGHPGPPGLAGELETPVLACVLADVILRQVVSQKPGTARRQPMARFWC